MLNIIWLVLLVGSAAVAVFTGQVKEVVLAATESAGSAFKLALGFTGIMALWLGLMRIAEQSGLIGSFTRLISPLMRRLFPRLPDGHPALGSMTMNIVANMFGLSNAATPLGIRAMQDLQSLNEDPEKVTWEIMLFVVINTASIQLVPFTVIGILSDFGSKNPSWVVFPTFLATILSAAFAVGALWFCRRVFK